MGIDFKKVGIIGAGKRGVANLGKWMVTYCGECKLLPVALYDKYDFRAETAREFLLDAFKAEGIDEEIRVFKSFEALIDDESLDLIMITTPQDFHMPPFVYAMESGKKVYCDKPLAHNLADNERMFEAWTRQGSKNAIIGFTRRYENSWNRAKELVDKGSIGAVQMILSRVVIPHASYLSRWMGVTSISGGVLNEKGAHLFDTINWFADANPTHIHAFAGRRNLAPQKDAPKRCSRCDRADCPYRVKRRDETVDSAGMNRFLEYEEATDDRYLINDACVFSEDCDSVDHATVNIQYDNGVKAQLFLTITGPTSEDCETLEIIGESGSIQLERHTATLKMKHTYGKERVEIDAKDENHDTSHRGADIELVRTLSAFVHGNVEPPVSVKEGYIATRMAMKALESAEQLTVCEL